MSKIIHVTKTYNGGGGTYALRLSAALRKAGVESSILALDDRSLRPQGGLLDRGAQVVDRVIAAGYQRRSRAPFHTFLRTRKWETNESIGSKDIVHLQSITGFIGARGLDDLLRARPRVFWTAHNPWLFTGGCVAYDECEKFMTGCQRCPILKPPLGHMAAVELLKKRKWIERFEVQPIANSAWMARMMRRSPVFETFPEIPVVPPIIDEVFNSSHDSLEVRKLLGVPDDRFVIGLAASSLTDPGKGISEFFETLPRDAKWLKNVIFLLIGDGSVRTPTEVSAIFTGRFSNPLRMATLYRACDLFVSPSFMETFGMAIAEAQACGTPVLSFETGGTPEAVYPNKPCGLVNNRDFASLHGAIESAVCRGPIDATQRAALGEWVVERFGATSIAQRQIDIYQKRFQASNKFF